MVNNLGVTASSIVGDQLVVTLGVTGATAIEDATIELFFDGTGIDSASVGFVTTPGLSNHTINLAGGLISIAATYNIDPLPGANLFTVTFNFAAGTLPESFQINVAGNNGAVYTTPVDVVLYADSFNTLPTGELTLSGTLTQNETLTAANTIVDFDGFSGVSHQWQYQDLDTGDWMDIEGATATTYVLGQVAVGNLVRVVATYTDDQGNLETFVSAPSADPVANVNDAPVAAADTLAATEDTADTFLASELLGNDSDLDGDTLVIHSVTSGTGGVVSLDIDGNVLFTPDANFNGEASFSYVASDGNGGLSADTAVTVNVAPVDDPLTGGVTISGTPRQGQTLSIVSTLADVDGIASVGYQWRADGVDIDGATGTTFTLTQEQVGAIMSVLVTVMDNGGTESTASDTLAETVANLNDAPEGTDGTLILDEDDSHILTAADFGFSDPVDGTDSLAAVKITSLPGAGELRYNGVAITQGQVDGGYEVSAADLGSDLLVFVPAANASGEGYASFTFQVRDDGGTANGGVDLDPTANTITFDVTAINDAPVLDTSGSPALGGIAEDVAEGDNTGTTVAALVVDGSITDADGSPVEFIYVTAADDAHGSWQFSTDGATWSDIDFSGANAGKGLLLAADDALRFVPAGDWHGSATITFGAWDESTGTAGSYADISVTGGTSAFSTATDTAAISVSAVADIADDSVTTDEDQAVDIDVLANDSFEGTPSVTGVTDGSHGTVTVIESGTKVRYTPNDNFHGSDSFTYTVTSGGVTETATVDVTVDQVNDAAQFDGDTSGSGNEDSQQTGTLTVADAIDGMTTPGFRIDAGDGAARGTATIDGTTGAWTYDPDANFNGVDSFTVSVTDDDGNVETHEVSLSVAAVNDVPVNAVPGTQTVDEDQGLVFSSANGNAITVSDSADTDVGGTDSLNTTLIVTAGVLSITPGSGALATGDGTASVSLQGTAAQINAALAGLTYTPEANFNGSDTLTITTSDLGNSGAGGVLSDETELDITVNPVNDDPTGTLLIADDGGTLVRGAVLTADTSAVADVDGLGEFSYQWLADGEDIDGASASTFTLTAAQEGTTVSVVVSYTDGDGTPETVTADKAIPATMSIGGLVYHWQNQVLLGGVTLSATPEGGATYQAVTPLTGSYLLDPLPVADQAIAATRTTADEGSAITAADARALLKILVGRNPNADPDGEGPGEAPPLSPFQVMAGDVDGNGTLNINDAIGILKMAVGAADAPPMGWLFVEESRVLWQDGASVLGTGSGNAAWDPAILYPQDGTGPLNLVAVLKGDLNSSWGRPPNLPADSQFLDPDYFADNAGLLGVPLDLWSI